MEKSSQIAWKIVPLRHFFPLKVVPLIEVLLYLVWYSDEVEDRDPKNLKHHSRKTMNLPFLVICGVVEIFTGDDQPHATCGRGGRCMWGGCRAFSWNLDMKFHGDEVR
jgi:hypothetical protein